MNSEQQSDFRVLFGQFLFRIVDFEILSDQADVSKLLGQFAAMLSALSLMFSGGASRILRSQAPSAAVLTGAWVDEHFLIATTMAITGLLAALLWDAPLPNQRDLFVLRPLPVRWKTVLAAKIAAATSVLAGAVAALNVFTGISYPVAIGVAHGGFFSVLRAFIAYWATMMAAAAFMFGCVLALQAVPGLLLPRRYALRISAALQLATFTSILAVFFLQPPLATPAMMTDPTNTSLLAKLPSYWFLGLFHQLNGSPHEALTPWARRAWIGLLAAFLGGVGSLMLSYASTVRETVEEPDIKPNRGGSHRGARSSDPLHAAVFHFCARTLLRSRQHRIILSCYLGIGLAISLAYCRAFLYGRYSGAIYAWRDVNRPLLVATVVLMCFAVVGTRVAFAVPTSLQANWIFRTAVARRATDYMKAVRSCLFRLTVVPAVTVATGLLLCIWPTWPVLGHALFLVLLGTILTDLCLLRFRKVPLACSYLPGKAQLHVTAGALILVLLALTDIGVKIEAYALQHPVRYALLMGPAALLAIFIRWRVAEEFASPALSLKFDETPAASVLTLDLEPDSGISQTEAPELIDSPGAPEPEQTPGWRWPLRIAAFSGGLLAVLLFAGLLYQRIAGEIDISAFPRPGRLIAMGEHRLHLHCVGIGEPVVLLESGHGNGMLTWGLVQPEVAKHTRVCSYDRAGYGWSDLGPRPRSVGRLAEELRLLLQNAGEREPLILVGHSLGGAYVQYFAASYPDLVAGLVLVDATHEDTFSKLPTLFRWMDWSVAAAQRLRAAGISRLYPQSTDGTQRAFENSTKQLAAMTAEEVETGDNLDALRTLAPAFGAIPLVVLTSESTARIDYVRPLQARLSERSNNSKQLVVEGSTHAIHRSRPDAVIEAIREVVIAARGSAPLAF